MNIPIPYQATLLFTSDVHGHMLPIRYADNSPEEYGLLKLASLVKKIRSERSNVLFIDNGDLLQGTPFAYYHACLDRESPHPIVAAMNALELDAFVPGNHEFNYGLPFVERARAQSEFPWLSANLLRAGTGEPYFGRPYLVFELECGARIGLVGLTTPYIPNWEQPANIEGLAFEPAVDAARRWVAHLKKRERADVVVVSYHGGFERDLDTGEETEEQTGENEGWRLCREVEGIDVLLTGHQHRRIEGAKIAGTHVVQPGYQGSCLAQIELGLARDDAGRWSLVSVESSLREAGEAESDRELAERMRENEERVQGWLDRPLCEVQGEMRIFDPMEARLREHPLIELVNRIQMEASGADISCTSLFDNRSPGFGPRVSMREVTANYPFPNTLRVLRLNGADIRAALERTAAYFTLDGNGEIAVSPSFVYPKPQHYNYDMWEGIEYEIDVSLPIGSRIRTLTRDGRPLDPEGQYDVVMNHYRASGGGDYRMFRGKPVVREVTVDMTEIIAEYLSKAVVVRASANGNWKVYS
ncbi:bifunctional metallophosphatase/5'-nucleotidase [Cohnella hongkongensis]|uniref:Bifunctional metallophosphatase/5'-nucleotidase n=1 Tax=Cohnella hongkongensis TaxID=178337 RepID=A0ABV9FGB9_9BACL